MFLLLLCRCHRTWKEQNPVYLTKVDSGIFRKSCCLHNGSCFFQPLVTAKSNWIYTVSQNYNAMFIFMFTYFYFCSPNQPLICFIFLGASEMNSYLFKKSIHNIHLEWKQWNSTPPRWIFHFEQIRFLLLPPLAVAVTFGFPSAPSCLLRGLSNQ